MATILSKTFDTQHGAVILQVQDALGTLSSHSIYVLNLAGTVDDEIAKVLADVDAAATAIHAKFVAAGWVQGADSPS